MNNTMSSVPLSQLSLIVDPESSAFPFKKLRRHLSCSLMPQVDHHYWHFGGLRSFTIPFDENTDEETIDQLISKLKEIQNKEAHYPPFWITHKKCQYQSNSLTTSTEFIKKNLQLGKVFSNDVFKIEYTSGALVQIDKYIYDMGTELKDGLCLTFYHDRIDIDYEIGTDKHRKTIKAAMIDKCTIRMTERNKFTFFINMHGNDIHYAGSQNDDIDNPEQGSSSQKTTVPITSYKRMAPREPRPYYSTIRLVISVSNDLDEDIYSEYWKHLNYAYKQFTEFFQRNDIKECIGIIKSVSAEPDLTSKITSLIKTKNSSFIKQYCWAMLTSIGYRFQHRLTEKFIEHMNSIEDDDEFYQKSLHIWRRSNEYYFIDLIGALHRYQEKIKTLEPSSLQSNYSRRRPKKELSEKMHWSLSKPPNHYQYVPSVTLTPTTIFVKPFKLVKTHRVLREPQFGGNLMFALVEFKDENGIMDIFPNDFRALRWKIEALLVSGFDLGQQGRTYRYLHHSQSQLKDKQFWFYHHEENVNFSFDDAYDWMGDFQSEKVVAKHAARIAQCFTSAEATIQIKPDEVEYIDDIRNDKYNFTDGVGTMSTTIRDKINPRHQFSAMQIRYGGCKGVVSVNPNLDHSEHKLLIRKSMEKFRSPHDILELCRISKPRPMYLNRQIIVLLSHRIIHDSRFLLLQNSQQRFLAESLVYPQRAQELLSEKLSRNLFPLRELNQDARINLIQEPFFSQLLITIGKFELSQMRERTRLKLPKNLARNMIGIVDEYGVLEYGQVYIQYTELNDDSMINGGDSERTVILKQQVVVTKNPCYHPGDIRVFTAVDAPKLRHLKDVIVFPQKGHRPHPNEISGSDLDGDEYAVIWHPDFVPTTNNDPPYDYDSQVSEMIRITGRPVNRADIRETVLDISEQCCIGKLCSLHLASMDLHGIAHPKTLAIAGYIAQELDAPKTGHHPLKPSELVKLRNEIGNKRPDYFDNPNYKLYPSRHILGQLFRSSNRFETHWKAIQTPPTTVNPAPVDPLFIHHRYTEYMASVQELARAYRDSIMDIMYVYRFSSDIDILCRFDSSQYKTPMTKQQTESSCIVADSAQMEFKLLMRLIRSLFFEEFRSCDRSNPFRCHSSCPSDCADRKRAKASALYSFCYGDISHARRILSLPWLFAPLLIETRKQNIEKQAKLLSPSLVEKMLEVQPYCLIGQSLQRAIEHIMSKEKPFYFHHIFSHETPNQVTVCLRPRSDAKFLSTKRQIPLMHYLVLEILHHYVVNSLSSTHSDITSSNPLLVESAWQHILTRSVLNKCSPSVLQPATNNSTNSITLTTVQTCWSDEQACTKLQDFMDISAQCASHASEANDYAHANEYLVIALQKMATTGTLFEA